jgi:membrane-bound serine protease (ClpP class)
MTLPPEPSAADIHVGDVGTVVSSLRPAGKARFGEALTDVVAEGEFLDVGTEVEIMSVHGSRVVVRRVPEQEEA